MLHSLESRAPKFDTPDDFTKIEVDSREQTRGATRIAPIPLTFAALFWVYQLERGNTQARPLVAACVVETLTRRADTAFGVTRSEDEYQAASAEFMKLLGRVAHERDVLLENYDIDDDARQLADVAWSEVTRLEAENERLREQLRRYQ